MPRRSPRGEERANRRRADERRQRGQKNRGASDRVHPGREVGHWIKVVRASDIAPAILAAVKVEPTLGEHLVAEAATG